MTTMLNTTRAPALTASIDGDRIRFGGSATGSHSIDLTVSTVERVEAHADGYAMAAGGTGAERDEFAATAAAVAIEWFAQRVLAEVDRREAAKVDHPTADDASDAALAVATAAGLSPRDAARAADLAAARAADWHARRGRSMRPTGDATALVVVDGIIEHDPIDLNAIGDRIRHLLKLGRGSRPGSAQRVHLVEAHALAATVTPTAIGLVRQGTWLTHADGTVTEITGVGRRGGVYGRSYYLTRKPGSERSLRAAWGPWQRGIDQARSEQLATDARAAEPELHLADGTPVVTGDEWLARIGRGDLATGEHADRLVAFDDRATRRYSSRVLVGGGVVEFGTQLVAIGHENGRPYRLRCHLNVIVDEGTASTRSTCISG